MGRPSSYTPEIAEQICQRLKEGETLRQICRSEGMPSKTAVLHWLRDREDFRAQYAHARELQTDHWADEIIDIADDGSNDWIEREKKDGSVVTLVDQENINRSR